VQIDDPDEGGAAAANGGPANSPRKWGWSENKVRAKFLTLTKAGLKHLKAEVEKDSWRKRAAAIAEILNTTWEISSLRHSPCASTREVLRSHVEVVGEALMTDKRIDLPQGTLDLLILRTLALEPQHGWAISERIQQMSSEVLLIQQGSLYPALHRLERRGWVKAKWGTSENNRRARYYELTKTGRKQLERETDSWKKLAAAVARIIESV